MPIRPDGETIIVFIVARRCEAKLSILSAYHSLRFDARFRSDHFNLSHMGENPMSVEVPNLFLIQSESILPRWSP